MKFLPMVAVLVAATPTLAEEQRAKLTAMFSVDGECQMLIVSEEERSCKDVVITTEYDSGRIGFYFIDDRALMM